MIGDKSTITVLVTMLETYGIVATVRMLVVYYCVM